MLPYPKFDPVLVTIGPIAIRWYGLAYLAGILIGLKWVSGPLKKAGFTLDDTLNWVSWLLFGIILGGRLGYILVYGTGYYLENPIEIIAVWNGGMSYHGGALGALIATILFAKTHKKSKSMMLDQLGIGSTFGLFFGRIANFINGELPGRLTHMPWGMVFPGYGPLPRHPSQLYEAVGEGIILFLILAFLQKNKVLKPGQLFAVYLIGYGLIRLGLELFREPDSQLGFIVANLTMGQLLSLLMISLGVAIFRKKPFRI